MKKKQIILMVSIAAISFLIGSTFDVMTMAEAGESPWDSVWRAIFNLQSGIDSLNTSLVELEGQIRLPKVITLNEPGRVFIPGDDEWHDVVCVPDVSITEGTDVVVIAHVGIDDGYIKLKVSTDSTFTGWHRIDRVGPSYAYGEFHVVFTDMPAGTYTFTLLGRTTYPSNLGVHTRQLTLIVIQGSQ